MLGMESVWFVCAAPSSAAKPVCSSTWQQREEQEPSITRPAFSIVQAAFSFNCLMTGVSWLAVGSVGIVGFKTLVY